MIKLETVIKFIELLLKFIRIVKLICFLFRNYFILTLKNICSFYKLINKFIFIYILI